MVRLWTLKDVPPELLTKERTKERTAFRMLSACFPHAFCLPNSVLLRSLPHRDDVPQV